MSDRWNIDRVPTQREIYFARVVGSVVTVFLGYFLYKITLKLPELLSDGVGLFVVLATIVFFFVVGLITIRAWFGGAKKPTNDAMLVFSGIFVLVSALTLLSVLFAESGKGVSAVGVLPMLFLSVLLFRSSWQKRKKS
ncbi:MAG: hypothetical protein AAF402_06315 [Pseudomonadota bacterium]